MNIKIITLLVIRIFHYEDIRLKTRLEKQNINSNYEYNKKFCSYLFSFLPAAYMSYKYRQLHGSLNFPPYQFERILHSSRYAKIGYLNYIVSKIT